MCLRRRQIWNRPAKVVDVHPHPHFECHQGPQLASTIPASLSVVVDHLFNDGLVKQMSIDRSGITEDFT